MANPEIDLWATDEVHFQFYSGSWQTHSTVSSNLANTTFYHVGVRYDDTGNQVRIWVNGAQLLSQPQIVAMTANAHPFRIGFDSGAEYFTGRIDEVRVSVEARPAEWNKAEYYTGFDLICDFGAEETIP